MGKTSVYLEFPCVFLPQSQSSLLNSSVVLTDTPNVVLEGLRPGTGYVVQVRARTVAGYGAYSKEMLFQTLTDGKRVGGCVCVSEWGFYVEESAERGNAKGCTAVKSAWEATKICPAFLRECLHSCKTSPLCEVQKMSAVLKALPSPKTCSVLCHIDVRKKEIQDSFSQLDFLFMHLQMSINPSSDSSSP